MTPRSFNTGGNGTIVWSATGLPTNLSINISNGQLTGTPNVTGTFSATITATDAGGCVGTKAVTVAVAPVANTDSYNGGMVDNTQAVVTGGTTSSPSTPFVTLTGSVLGNDAPSGPPSRQLSFSSMALAPARPRERSPDILQALREKSDDGCLHFASEFFAMAGHLRSPAVIWTTSSRFDRDRELPCFSFASE